MRSVLPFLLNHSRIATEKGLVVLPDQRQASILAGFENSASSRQSTLTLTCHAIWSLLGDPEVIVKAERKSCMARLCVNLQVVCPGQDGGGTPLQFAQTPRLVAGLPGAHSGGFGGCQGPLQECNSGLSRQSHRRGTFVCRYDRCQ